MLLNYVLLNYTGLDKLMAHFDTLSPGPPCRPTFTHTTLAHQHFFVSRRLHDLLEQTVDKYAELMGKDRGYANVQIVDAMTKFQPNAWDIFTLGMKFAFAISLFIWVIVELKTSSHATEFLNSAFFPVYRGVGMILALLWFFGLNVCVWEKFGVNYVYLFELDPRNRLSYLQVNCLYFFSSLLTHSPFAHPFSPFDDDDAI
jgi:hypothetical protein